MRVKDLYHHARYQLGISFFTGVPDSLLSPFLKELDKEIREGGTSTKHIIAAHESQAVGIAVGAMLAGSNAAVYTQNSGVGNLVNPIASLCLPYNLQPWIIIGHREGLPQHRVMAKIDDDIMQLLGYKKYLLVKE